MKIKRIMTEDDFLGFHDKQAPVKVQSVDRDKLGGIPAELLHYFSLAVIVCNRNPFEFW